VSDVAAGTARVGQLRAAVGDLDPPLAVLDADAFQANASDLVRRAAGTPIRVASKSLRVRGLLDRALAVPGFAGVLCYQLPEALWLHGKGFDDLVLGYPTVNRAALARLAADESAASAITLMIDDVAQLDLIDAVAAPGRRPALRVAVELDAAYRPGHGAVHLGARRSPLHAPRALARLAATIARRPGFRLVGMMAYEGQIAGVGDAGRGLRARAVRMMQRSSATELVQRRAEAVAAVRAIAELEFVNGGGTGSIECTAAEEAVTEVAAGSGLIGPGLFDHYRGFRPAPAAYFVLPVVRRPSARIATLGGGGWIASGPAGADRLPVLADPPGLRYLGQEGPGEVQTPVRGRPARRLAIGDTVWLRHAKAGELAEHVDAYQMVAGDARSGVLRTYRGEGKAF
jgi:D-serine deaminase-like pyridoxal phosphate-dependent protein